MLHKRASVSPPVGIVYAPVDTGLATAHGARVLADYLDRTLIQVPDAALHNLQTALNAADVPWSLEPEFDVIQVNGYSFASGTTPDLPADLSIPDYAGPVGLYLVQLIGPPKGGWIDALSALGSVVAYYPENTYLMRMAPSVTHEVRALTVVQHVSVYQPAYKFQPSLLQRPAQEPVRMIVQVDVGQNTEEIIALLREYSSAPVDVGLPSDLINISATLTAPQAQALSSRPEVIWIEAAGWGAPSGERNAMIAAGLHDGFRPDSVALDEMTSGTQRQSGGGYTDWLYNTAGFCQPGGSTQGCTDYLTNAQVAVLDTGLDRNECADYLSTGTCNAWAQNGALHHKDFILSTVTPAQDKETSFFCSKYAGRGGLLTSRCFERGTYNFSDLFGTGGHGTHAASVIAGMDWETDARDPYLAYYQGTGIAPGLEIVVGKMIDNRDQSHIWPIDATEYERLVAEIYDASPDVGAANNSWKQEDQDGNPVHSYNTLARVVDQLVRDADGNFNQKLELPLVFAAGNAVQGGPEWLQAPAMAKNVITVGASSGWELEPESRMCVDNYPTLNPNGVEDCVDWHPEAGCDWDDPSWPFGHCEVTRSGECGCYPTDYPTQTCEEVPCLDNRVNVVEQYSCRRFETDPDFIKPDIVAPAGEAMTASSAGMTSDDSTHCAFEGTSSATPVVTGAIMLLRAWYLDHFGSAPSPAMLKAMLIAHAADMNGGIDQLTNTTMGHSPSPAQGWGRLDMQSLFLAPLSRDVRDQVVQLSPGDIYYFSFQADDPSQPVNLVLAFSDAPTALNAQRLLVNKLILKVVEDNGKGHWQGNFFDATGYSETMTGFPRCIDDSNNVRVIRIPPGVLSQNEVLYGHIVAFQVVTSAIPGVFAPRQDFALYLYNGSFVN